MKDMDWKHSDAEGSAFWRIYRALKADYAIQMLSDDAIKALAGTIAEWLTQGGTPNRTAARINMPRMLETTPFAIFGEGTAKRVTKIAVEACWPESKEDKP